MSLTMNLGERVRARRIEVGLTQARLAHMAHVSRRHVAALEKGANVSVLVLTRVSGVLDVPPATLFSNEPLSSAAVPIGYASVFISYGGPDEAIARRIYEDLTFGGVRCFFFPVTATPGIRLHRTMTEAIRQYDRVVLLCSTAALRRPGVSNEIEQVLAREAEEGGTERIIPVALDDCLWSDAPAAHHGVIAQIRQRVIADFRRALGDEDAWDREFDRILDALRRR